MAPLRSFRRFYGLVRLRTEQGNQPMTQRIIEREIIQTIEGVTDELNEINNMLRNVIADIRSAHLFLTAARESDEKNG